MFQKAFVEFFVPATPSFFLLKEKLDHAAEAGQCDYYAVNARGDFHSSEEAGAGKSGAKGREKQVHVVTWGSFKGKEIATATLVEEVSFRAWGEEAFAVWAEWGRCVAAGGGSTVESGSAAGEGDEMAERRRRSAEFLKRVTAEGWLVNVVGHGFREGGGLWDLLME